MNVHLKSFSVCSFDIRFVSGCQCMHVPQYEWQVAFSEWNREAEQGKLETIQKILKTKREVRKICWPV